MDQTLQTLYGARGFAGSGKDFTVDALLKILDPIAEADMNATSLKHAINHCITANFKDEILEYNPNTSFTNSEAMISDADFEMIKNDNQFMLPTVPKMSVRRILQIFGTDIIRQVSEDFHIKMLARRLLKSKKEICFITDIRFQNENNFITEFNKQNTDIARSSFLTSIAKLEKSMVPQPDKFGNTISDIFGNSEFSNDLSSQFSNMFHDPEFLVDNYTNNDLLANKSISITNSVPYSNSFIDELNRGILFILRKSNRDLPDHKSENFNKDLVTNMSDLPDAEQVFSNSISPIEDNPQFRIILTTIINSLFRSLEKEDKISIVDDIILPKNEISVKKLSQLLSDSNHSSLTEALFNYSNLPNHTTTLPDNKHEKTRQRA